jgi:hypothetical protein
MASAKNDPAAAVSGDQDPASRPMVSPVPGPMLGIESSCDETAAAVLDGDGTIMAEAVLS